MPYLQKVREGDGLTGGVGWEKEMETFLAFSSAFLRVRQNQAHKGRGS